jgi:hypothetical protein
MNRIIGVGLPAAGLVAIGVAVSSLLGIGAAGATAATVTAPATFQMYANVDSNGDLGSNYDAVSVTRGPQSTSYFVKFKKPIGSCAAVAQAGKAGGSDAVRLAASDIVPSGTNTFKVEFGAPAANGLDTVFNDPFMIMVTCKS